MLEDCVAGGYTIIVISNQLGVTKGHTTHDVVQARCACLAPYGASVFYATDRDRYRKPATGLFELAVTLLDLQPDKTASFYCGDAAGRATDFNITDRYFAENIDVEFRTPESYPNGDISKIAQKFKVSRELARPLAACPPLPTADGRQLVILVGPQAAGKTTFAKRLITEGYVHINRDAMGRQMMPKFNNAVSSGKNIVVDNTNPTKADREAYLEKAVGYNVTIYYWDIPKALCTHLCQMRVQMGGPYIPAVARNVYYSKVEAPTADEGQVHVIRGLVADIAPACYLMNFDPAN